MILRNTALLTILSAAAILSGCIVSDDVAPPVPPEPVVGTVADEAAAGMLAYAEGMAAEAERTAGTAEKFTDWQAAFDDWSKRNKAAREHCWRSYEKALNKHCLGKVRPDSEVPYDPEKLAAAAREAAEGYRRVKQ